MNFSMTNATFFNETEQETEEESGLDGGDLVARFALGLAMYTLALVTCVGNGMVIHAIRTEKRLRKVSNLFIMSLAVADLVVGCFVMPISAVYVLTDRWYLGAWLCDAWLSIDYCASTASIFNLFVLSLDRYWSITSPLKYLRRRTKRRAFFMIAAAWALSALWILPVTGWHSMVHPDGLRHRLSEHHCDTEFADNITFKVSAAVANFYVPTLSMLYIYGRIFNCIRQRSRNDLGEVSTGRTKGRTQQQQATTAMPIQQSPSMLLANASDNGETTSLHEEHPPLADQRHGGEKRQTPHHLAIPGWDKLVGAKWRPCKTALEGSAAAKTGTESESSVSLGANNRKVMHFYETLTLLELHHNGAAAPTAGSEEDVGSGLTHYVNVRVNVEYIGDSQQNQPPITVSDANNGNGSASGIKRGELRTPCKSSSTTPLVGIAGTGGNNTGSSVISAPNPSVLISHKERKAARQLGVIMAAFICCWLPYFIVFMVVAVCPDCVGDTLFKITLWLGYVNSTLNPVLYPLCNANFRRAFAKMLTSTCQSPCQPQQTYPAASGAQSSAAINQSRF